MINALVYHYYHYFYFHCQLMSIMFAINRLTTVNVISFGFPTVSNKTFIVINYLFIWGFSQFSDVFETK